MRELFTEAIEEILDEKHNEAELCDLPQKEQDKICDEALRKATDKLADSCIR